jgi:uncharacterized Zn finger protein
MSWGGYGWRPYVPVAERRARGASELKKLARKGGSSASPVVLANRKIATTFWGKAWCDNLKAYSDFANRLPRGRTYVRNGSVLDLRISAGQIIARVAGSELYTIKIKIKPLAASAWKAIQIECAGKIDSLLELLQGKLSSAVMQVVTRQSGGLFPSPRDIELDCSCPDWADLCKHVAATLYGIGARLDSNPELLFLLRGVDPSALVSQVSAAAIISQTADAASTIPAMSDAEVADVFGIEMDSGTPTANVAKSPPPITAPSAAGNSISRVGPSRKGPRRRKPKRKMSKAAQPALKGVAKVRWQIAKKKSSAATVAAVPTALPATAMGQRKTDGRGFIIPPP